MPGRLGFILNPVAGLGGRVGLKGSDGVALQARASELGGIARAPSQAAAALATLGRAPVSLLTVGGAMGEAACLAAGLLPTVVMRFGAGTTGRDTATAAAALVAAGADLILFAGGDGTARDVVCGAGRTPVLGIPGGVKMYSGVFATSAAQAGWLAAAYLVTPTSRRRTCDVELLDADPSDDEPSFEAVRAPSLRLHGVAVVPASPAVQRAKASVPPDDDRQLAALCRALAETLDQERVTIVGPGRTMQLFMAACGLPKTLLGVDVMHRGVRVVADGGERDILSAIGAREARIVVGLLGGQGCLFGRGNQPIGPAVLRRVARPDIVVLAGSAKVATLPQGLFVDTGEADVDRALAGFVRVHTAPGRTTMLRVRAP